jgi:hypothetical protein
MAIYAIETKISKGVMASEILRLTKQEVRVILTTECPAVEWMAFAKVGPSVYIDIFEAPDETLATKAAQIIRAVGKEVPETSIQIPWYRCLRQANIQTP